MVDLRGRSQTLVPREIARSRPERSIEDTETHRFHKTICSIQGSFDSAAVRLEAISRTHFRIFHPHAYRCQSFFPPPAADICAKGYHERLAVQGRTRSPLETRTSAKIQSCRRTQVRLCRPRHGFRTSHTYESSPRNSVRAHPAVPD